MPPFNKWLVDDLSDTSYLIPYFFHYIELCFLVGALYHTLTYTMHNTQHLFLHFNICNAQHLFPHFEIHNTQHTHIHHSDPPSHPSTVMPITLKDNNLPSVHWWWCNTSGNAIQLHYLIIPIMLLGAMLAVLVQHAWVSVILLSFPPLSMSYCHF